MDTEKVDRNQAIVDEYLDGGNITRIAAKYGITGTRVKQVLDKADVRKTRQPGSAGQYSPERWKSR